MSRERAERLRARLQARGVDAVLGLGPRWPLTLPAFGVTVDGAGRVFDRGAKAARLHTAHLSVRDAAEAVLFVVDKNRQLSLFGGR